MPRSRAPGGIAAAAAALLVLGLALGTAPQAVHAGEAPSDAPPGFLYEAKQPGSKLAPLISPANPLHRAVAFWDLKAVKALVEGKKVGINAAVAGYTPLQVAFMGADSCGARCIGYSGPLREIMMYLLCKGANANPGPVKELKFANDLGNQPLHLATLVGDPALVHALLRAGANPAQKNGEGFAPLDTALKCDSREGDGFDNIREGVVQALLAYGAPKLPASAECRSNCPKACAAAKSGLPSPKVGEAIKAGAAPPPIAKDSYENYYFAKQWALALTSCK